MTESIWSLVALTSDDDEGLPAVGGKIQTYLLCAATGTVFSSLLHGGEVFPYLNPSVLIQIQNREASVQKSKPGSCRCEKNLIDRFTIFILGEVGAVSEALLSSGGSAPSA